MINNGIRCIVLLMFVSLVCRGQIQPDILITQQQDTIKMSITYQNISTDTCILYLNCYQAYWFTSNIGVRSEYCGRGVTNICFSPSKVVVDSFKVINECHRGVVFGYLHGNSFKKVPPHQKFTTHFYFTKDSLFQNFLNLNSFRITLYYDLIPPEIVQDIMQYYIKPQSLFLVDSSIIVNISKNKIPPDRIDGTDFYYIKIKDMLIMPKQRFNRLQYSRKFKKQLKFEKIFPKIR